MPWAGYRPDSGSAGWVLSYWATACSAMTVTGRPSRGGWARLASELSAAVLLEPEVTWTLKTNLVKASSAADPLPRRC